MSESFETSKDVTWLKELYFSDPDRHLVVPKGETLLVEGKHNDRLFLILEGSLTGYLRDENDENFEVLRSFRNMFVGVYSFFSPDQTSYLTVMAEEDTRVAYIGENEKSKPSFANHFLPVIVHEIYLRQLIAQRLTQQRQAAIKKLYEKEKMATLGQLAAGLAHELNNAIGVLSKNTDWLSETTREAIRNKRLRELFETTLEEGQSLSTSVLREKRKKLEKRFQIPPMVAKQLAKTSLTEDQIHALLKESSKELESISLITETGIVLHDMKIASTHAAHVVQSVRELGASNTEKKSDTSIAETITRAVVLTKTLMHQITVSIEKETEGKLVANPGDLVQVWVNLIKNACESMTLNETPEPALTIRIQDPGDGMYTVIVRDNGVGISQEIIPKIFQPNFTTKVTGLSFGLGVGLSIVKKIINYYKGTITVSSKPGETSFIVQLPKP